jgi:hypothetical protein
MQNAKFKMQNANVAAVFLHFAFCILNFTDHSDTAFRIWNGVLFTIPITIDEKR